MAETGKHNVLKIIKGPKNKKVEIFMVFQRIFWVGWALGSPISMVINKCMDEAVFPALMKVACEVPIYKKDILMMIAQLFQRSLKISSTEAL